MTKYRWSIITRPKDCDDEYIDYTVSGVLYKNLGRFIIKKPYTNENMNIRLDINRGVDVASSRWLDKAIETMIPITGDITIYEKGDYDIYSLFVDV